MEVLPLIALAGTMTGIVFSIIRYETRRLCKDIDEVKKDVKEIHEEVFH